MEGKWISANAMEGWCPLRGTDYFARHNFGLAGKFRDCHGHMVPVVNCFEGFDLVWAGINHH